MFTSLFGISVIALILAIGLCISAYLFYIKNRQAWMRYCLLYLFALVLYQAVWSFVLVSELFHARYLRALSAVLSLFRLAVSCVLVYTVPVFILLLLNKLVSLKIKLALLIVSFCMLTAGVITMIWQLSVTEYILSILFNTCLLGFTLLGITRQKIIINDRLKRFILFLLYLSALYFLWSAVAVNMLRRYWSAEKIIFADSLARLGFLFAIAVTYLPYFIVKLGSGKKRKGEPLRELMTDKNLSSRDEKIVELIIRGLSNKEIGSILGIPMELVDSSIFDIYRKFGVNNRREFLGKVKPAIL